MGQTGQALVMGHRVERLLAGIAIGVLSAVRSFGQFAAQPAATTASPAPVYRPLHSVSGNVAPYLFASGERLQKAGKERITAVGSVQYGAGQQAVPIQITWQTPLQVRVDQGPGPVILDRSDPGSTIPAAQRDADLVETLAEDGLEGLLSVQSTDGGVRHLGFGFGATDLADKTGSFDLINAVFSSPFRQKKPVSKTFWFDNRTKLLSRVTYKNASGIEAEVLLSDWRTVQGEQIPFSIERRERGQTMMLIKLVTAVLAAATDNAPFRGN